MADQLRRSAAVFATLCVGALLAGGCAAPAGDTSLRIEGGEYDRAFDAARDALREARFDLDRVDARAGLITTHPAGSSGWATPWIAHAQSGSEATEGLLHKERRLVTVSFRPGSEPARNEGQADTSPEAISVWIVEVDVAVERVYRPGRRVDSTRLGLGGFAVDEVLVRGRMQPSYPVVVRRDDRLAATLADDIRKRMQAPDR